MRLLVSWVTSSLGRKVMMALSGLLLFAFLIGHALGNSLFFNGPAAINGYAQGLKNLPFGLLWIVRIGLFLLFSLHVVVGISLWISNRKARPQGYVCDNTVQASIASRTMIYSGLIILAFVVYHIAHFTLRLVNNTGEHIDPITGHPDVFVMIQSAFHQPAIAGVYVAAMAVLLLHLTHGLASMFQTMGIRHKNLDIFADRLVPLTGWLVVAAFVSLPIVIFVGLR